MMPMHMNNEVVPPAITGQIAPQPAAAPSLLDMMPWPQPIYGIAPVAPVAPEEPVAGIFTPQSEIMPEGPVVDEMVVEPAMVPMEEPAPIPAMVDVPEEVVIAAGPVDVVEPFIPAPEPTPAVSIAETIVAAAAPAEEVAVEPEVPAVASVEPVQPEEGVGFVPFPTDVPFQEVQEPVQEVAPVRRDAVQPVVAVLAHEAHVRLTVAVGTQPGARP